MAASEHKGLDVLTRILEHDPVRQMIQNKLAKNPLFLDLNKSEIEILSRQLVGYRANKGDAVFVEGNKAGYLCFVIDGHLDIVKDTGTGKSRKISNVAAGRIIGEMSLIDGEPHSATAIASEPTLLAALTDKNLNELVEKYPVLGAKLYRKIAFMISQRLRRSDAELVNFLD